MTEQSLPELGGHIGRTCLLRKHLLRRCWDRLAKVANRFTDVTRSVNPKPAYHTMLSRFQLSRSKFILGILSIMLLAQSISWIIMVSSCAELYE